MKNDYDPLGSFRDGIDAISKMRHDENQMKQNRLLEEQVRLQKEANELEKRRLAEQQEQQGSATPPLKQWTETDSRRYKTERDVNAQRILTCLEEAKRLVKKGFYTKKRCPQCWGNRIIRRISGFFSTWECYGGFTGFCWGLLSSECRLCGGSNYIYVTKSGREIVFYLGNGDLSYARMSELNPRNLKAKEIRPGYSLTTTNQIELATLPDQ